MTNLTLVISLLGIFLFQAKCLDFIYLFQIKEYRFDRFFVFLRENNLLNVFYLRHIRMPKKSMRNMILTVASWILAAPFIVGIPIYFNQAYRSNILPTTSVMIIISPFTAFLSVALTIGVTEFFAKQKRQAIIEKARRLIDVSNVTLIGITGSYGKSTVKEFLYELLKDSFPTAKTDENKNTDVGVAMSIIKSLKPDSKYFVAEMGAYRLGEIKKICDFAYPKFGIITAIGNQHLALFGSKENLVKAKKELADSLPVNGTLYICDRTDKVKELTADLRCKIIYYGSNLSSPAKYKVADGKIRIEYSGVIIEAENLSIGEHNLKNLVPAILLAYDLGVDHKKISEIIGKLQAPKGKLNETRGINGSIILDDVYSSNLNGFLAAIDKLKNFQNMNKLVASRGIIELGSEKRESYDKIIEKIKGSNCRLLTTDPDFVRPDTGNNVVFYKNEDEMFEYLKGRLNNESVLLIEGRFPDSFINGITL